MKRMLRVIFEFVAVGGLVLASGPAQAQTTANGPYYATPAWDQTLACTTTATCPRFIVLSNMNSEAVLDRETGLVWERSPGDTNGDGVVNASDTVDWFAAPTHCNGLSTGGRKGWRLPTIQELASLADPNNLGGNPDLPPGHPFSKVQSSVFWSATTNASDTSSAWFVNFDSTFVFYRGKSNTHFVWCVRGGQGVDPQ